MSFFNTSFFSDFKIPDILSLPQQEEEDDGQKDVSVSEDQNTMASSSKEEGSSSSSSYTESLPSTESEIESSSQESESKKESESGIWNFGGLVKSIALKSEGLLQVYKKDLEEFRVGLQNETKIIKDVAVLAVKDLPTSIETGTTLAKESIGSVGFGQVIEDFSSLGQVIEDFSSSVLRGTADIISQGKEAVLKLDEEESSTFLSPPPPSSSRYENGISPIPLSGGKYSRFEVQAMSLQHDSRTYCDEPEDVADFTSWKSTFTMLEKEEEIKTLLASNAFLKDLLVRFVPDVVVDEETFWTRYFYKFHKLKQTEAARENLVKRASSQMEEDLSWDTEEEVEEELDNKNNKEGKVSHLKSENLMENRDSGLEGEHKDSALEQETIKGKDSASGSELKGEDWTSSNELIVRSREEGRSKSIGNLKEQSFVVKDESSQNLAAKVSPDDEDDLGWEVPEDSEEPSSKRSSNSEASWEVPEVPRDDVRRKLGAQDQDEEDLSWDVDDDDDAK